MTDTLDAPRARRRRSDAQRNIDAIVSSARTMLGEQPDASMEDIAAAAGVSRKTVYAHFPSRDTLISALIDAAAAETLDAIDAAQLDTRPPAEALNAFLDIGWQLLRRYPILLDPILSATPRPDNHDPHREVAARLERLIKRGQRSGHFDRTLPADWLAAAILGLGHTAAEHLTAGGISAPKAATLLKESTLRLCGATDAHP